MLLLHLVILQPLLDERHKVVRLPPVLAAAISHNKRLSVLRGRYGINEALLIQGGPAQ